MPADCEAQITAAGFPAEAVEWLRHYVYLYVDPRSDAVFYVGKGQADRAFDHLQDRSETDKVRRIQEIREAGLEPGVEILRSGLTEREALLVEAAAIDLLGSTRLTNRIRGAGAAQSGRLPVAEIVARHTAPEAQILPIHRVVLITINRLYYHGIGPDELYEATRGVWKVNVRRAGKANYAFAVYEGVVREVYRIARWAPAGAVPMKHRELAREACAGRHEFVGEIADDDVRRTYVGRRVRPRYLGKGSQNPIHYVNV